MKKDEQNARRRSRVLHPASGNNRSRNTEPRKETQAGWWLPVAALCLTAVAYIPVIDNQFILTWDDEAYVTGNLLIRDLSPASVVRILSANVAGSYVPLTLLSFAVDYSVWGLNPVPFHLTNVILHLAGTFLVFRLLAGLGVSFRWAAAGSLIFGIHPMGVESVAWVTERKDLLYSLFFLGSLVVYVSFVKKGRRSWLLYAGSLFLFVLALLSKIQAVTLPLVLLLVDYYFSRSDRWRIVLEKLPFFLLALVVGLAGVGVLQEAGSLRINEFYGFPVRILFGLFALGAYLFKFLLPFPLSAYHPWPALPGEPLPWWMYGVPVVLAVSAWLVWRTSRHTRAIVFGSLFFLLTIVFMLQIFGAGQGFLADRFSRVPYIGLIFATFWSLDRLAEWRKKSAFLVWTVFGIVAISFFIITFRRGDVWQNDVSLWSDAVSKYPGRDAGVYARRGIAYRDAGDTLRALADFSLSLRIRPDDHEVRLMRGNIYFSQGKNDSAETDYRHVFRIRRDNAQALGNLGAIFIKRNQPDSALKYLTASLRIDSTDATTFANRAVALASLGRNRESAADFIRCHELNPHDETVCMSIALTCQKMGEMAASIPWIDKALAIRPGFGNYYYFRSVAFRAIGDTIRASEDAGKALRLGTPVPESYFRSLR